MKHTPGPWKIRADLAITAYDTETEEHQPIARAFGDGSCETLFANTRLVSAAPDLLAALIGAEKCIAKSLTHLPPDTLGVYCGEWLGEIRETIAKATGE